MYLKISDTQMLLRLFLRISAQKAKPKYYEYKVAKNISIVAC